jgi:hypothetical protein
MVNTLTSITLPQFLADKTRHHTADPLFPDNSVTGVVHGDIVLEVDAIVGRGHGGLLGEEGGGFWGRHFERLVFFLVFSFRDLRV